MEWEFPNDYMAKCGAKWLHKNGVNVLCISPGKKNYSHVNFPLERIETAIGWLKKNGSRKIGIMGMSTAGMDALVAASYFSEITLAFGLTASDFVWQGFEQGKKRWMQGMACSGCVYSFLERKTSCLYAVCV